MKRNLKAAVAGVVAVAFAGGGLLTLATSAFAAPTAPPWEPDPNAANYSGIVFYDASGNVVTNGTNDLSNPFAYAVASTAADTQATKASLAFANPQHGVTTTNWSPVASEAGPTTFSPNTGLPAGTPADITAFAPTYPVVAASSANITSWLSSVGTGLDTTAGYVNTIQVRLTDSGALGHGNPAGTYWESDIAFNTTNAAITVEGTNVPANGWAQLYPFQTASTTTLTTNAVGGNVTTGNPITLTAAVTPTTAAGSVQFFDNGTYIPGSLTAQTGGSAGFTYTPAQGTHVYTASFVPGTPPGDPTSTAGQANASQVAGSTSSPVTITDNPPQTATTTSLTANPTSANYQQNVTLTATVGASDSSTAGVTGNVQFKDGTSNLGSPVATVVTGAGTTASPGVGTATLNTTTLSPGSHSITAVFTPTSNSYATSTSSAVTVTVAAPQVCNLPGSSCSDTQNIQVVVGAGTITITTPYTSTNPFVLPQMTLSSDGTFLQSTATFPKTTDNQIVVTSSLAPAYAWTLSVSATPLTSTGGGTIPASGLGLTGGTLENATGPGAYPGSVTFTGIPAHNPSPVDTDTNSGLTGSPQTFAHSTAADGTATMDGTLTLYAATSTPAGTYNGTITFSVS